MMKNIYSIQDGETTICSSALLAGMILGQLTGGALGDAIGRHRAMAVVMLLQVISAFVSAFSMKTTLGWLAEIFGVRGDDWELGIFEVLACKYLLIMKTLPQGGRKSHLFFSIIRLSNSLAIYSWNRVRWSIPSGSSINS